MRTYDIAMGKTPEYMAAVREVALPVRESYGVKLAGWYYTDIGALNKVVHIWAYRDFAHFEEAREAFRTDERWLNDYVPRVKGIILRQENQMMRASGLLRVDADGIGHDGLRYVGIGLRRHRGRHCRLRRGGCESQETPRQPTPTRWILTRELRDRPSRSDCGRYLFEAANYRFVLAVHQVDGTEADGASVLARIAVHRRVALLEGLFEVGQVQFSVRKNIHPWRRALELV